MDFLPGYKTKIAVILMVVLSGLKAAGIIDEAVFQALVTIASALGIWGVYNKVNRVSE